MGGKKSPLNKPSGELRTRSALSVSLPLRRGGDVRRIQMSGGNVDTGAAGTQVSEGADGDVVECQVPSDWSSRQ